VCIEGVKPQSVKKECIQTKLIKSSWEEEALSCDYQSLRGSMANSVKGRASRPNVHDLKCVAVVKLGARWSGKSVEESGRKGSIVGEEW
jgi:hypothetical protein